MSYQLTPLGSNYTFLVKIELDGNEGHAIYKPKEGEAPLWDFPSGTLYKREYAAYLLSEILGWGLIPFTIIRDGPYGVGSVQQFIDHDPKNNVFLATDDGTIGIAGTVIPAIEKSLEKIKKPAIFACGPEPMLKAVQDFAYVHQIPTQISVESYMGCGVGICQGCVLEKSNGTISEHTYHEKYSLVCIDGPVYQSKDVIIG